jgi:hypothetical protein
MPRFHVPWMQKYLVPKRKDPYIRITLDEFGSFAWNLCDGKMTVLQIADQLENHFGEAIAPVYERVGSFFRQLRPRGFVHLRKADGTIVK